jgi:UDPglucose 6-dehydrogenase
MLTIGIIGIGYVGGAIQALLEKHKHLYSAIKVYDKHKQINTFIDILNTDLVFICLPTPYDESFKNFNMSEIDNVINNLNNFNYKGLIIIKSTILPTYCAIKNDIFPNLKLIHNPEFLSAKTAVEDFEKQTHIVIGYTDYSKDSINIIKNFYEELFSNRINEITISITNCKVSGLMKLACNSFYATKIQFFTELYLLCEKMNLSFDEVKELMMKNNWINSHHTNIPGHDKTISFGGACFPKDISALNEFMISNNIPNKVISATIKERNEMRKD